jgi:hypothetical protein
MLEFMGFWFLMFHSRRLKLCGTKLGSIKLS